MATVHANEDASLGARVVSETALHGVSAGSALLHDGAGLLAVHDDAFAVTRIKVPSLERASLVIAGHGAPLPKATKPDFEAAVVAPDGAVHLFGSGSTERRCAIARLDLARGTVTLADRPDVYACVRAALELGAARPNIEGAVLDGHRLRLFHRGVGAPNDSSVSAIVDLPLAVLNAQAPAALGVQAFDLGELDGVRLGFTDAAVLAAGRTLFVAAAEDTSDAVADGPVRGSVIGVIDEVAATVAGGSIGTPARAVAARWARVLGPDGEPWLGKIEGIAADPDGRGAWVLTDPDDVARPTILARVELRGFV